MYNMIWAGELLPELGFFQFGVHLSRFSLQSSNVIYQRTMAPTPGYAKCLQNDVTPHGTRHSPLPLPA